MSCETGNLSGAGLRWERLRHKAREKGIPLFGGMDLTQRCNLRCLHCYANTPTLRAHAADELPTTRIHQMIDEITAAGCLFFNLAGGEPLLHPDFEAIYLHLKQNGLQVNVFTNGTLLEQRHAALFSEWPPNDVQVSLQGATAETYGRVTGFPDAYDKCLAGIRRLVDARVRVLLAFPALTLNRHELSAMRRLAEEMGVRCAENFLIRPAVDGDMEPTRYRLPPTEVAALAGGYTEQDALVDPETMGRSDRLFECGAGQNGFHVLADGTVSPCTFFRNPRFCGNLREMSFRDIWNQRLRGVAQLKKPENSACLQCRDRAYCRYCPAMVCEADGYDEACDMRRVRDMYCCNVAGARKALAAKGAAYHE